MTVKCPTCDSEVEWSAEASPYRPFCSERCKLLDLGMWLEEKYRIESVEDDEDDEGKMEDV